MKNSLKSLLIFFGEFYVSTKPYFNEICEYYLLVPDFSLAFSPFKYSGSIEFRLIKSFGDFFLYRDFLSYIFNVSENTEIIHLIKMIWLFSFIISSFKSASGPPKDPGGSKEDIFKIKEMIHRIFSVKTNIEPVPK